MWRSACLQGMVFARVSFATFGLTRLSIAQNKERQPGILEHFRLMNVSTVKVCHATKVCTSNRLSLPIRPVYISDRSVFGSDSERSCSQLIFNQDYEYRTALFFGTMFRLKISIENYLKPESRFEIHLGCRSSLRGSWKLSQAHDHTA